MELIVNRTKADVDRLNALKVKGWANLTDAEKEEWYGSAARGAYNYTDLNRVEAAVAELATKAGLSLITKTDWKASDVPTGTDMSRYIRNLNAIMAACPRGTVFPAIPATMSGLTYTLANNIEEMLYIAETAIHKKTHDLWEKFDCVYVAGHYQERSTPPNLTSTWMGNKLTFYRSYSFRSYDGYVLSEPVTFDPNTMAFDDVVGLYRSISIPDEYEQVDVITAASSHQTLAIKVECKCVAYASYIAPAYLPGTTSYGQIEVGENVAPESGTIVAGSTSGEYVVIRVNGKLYYYTKIY